MKSIFSLLAFFSMSIYANGWDLNLNHEDDISILGAGDYVKVQNKSSYKFKLEHDKDRCFFKNGDEGSRPERFHGEYPLNHSVGSQYVEIRNSGGCFFENPGYYQFKIQVFDKQVGEYIELDQRFYVTCSDTNHPKKCVWEYKEQPASFISFSRVDDNSTLQIINKE